jgi:hypothetical protein
MLFSVKKEIVMQTLNVKISDTEYGAFGFSRTQMNFTDLLEIVEVKIAKRLLDESLYYAKECGLSNMTMDEISNEVRAVRKNAKSYN